MQIGDSPFNSTASALKAGEGCHPRQPDALLRRRSASPASAMPWRRRISASTASRSRPRTSSSAPERSASSSFSARRFSIRATRSSASARSSRHTCPTSSGAAPPWSPATSPRPTAFRPNLDDVAAFVKRPKARAIFLNSPHNPTGGVATEGDLQRLADLVRGTNIAVFSDEPYDHMVWTGKHVPLLAMEGLLDQVVAATRSRSRTACRAGGSVTRSPASGSSTRSAR